jgi:hypothetical protein
MENKITEEQFMEAVVIYEQMKSLDFWEQQLDFSCIKDIAEKQIESLSESLLKRTGNPRGFLSYDRLEASHG